MRENMEILDRRWPALAAWLAQAPEAELLLLEGVPAPTLCVNGVQLAGAFAPRAEAELQGRLVPQDARSATVYGLGQGALPRALLRRSRLERLRLVLLSRAAARAALTYVELYDWLADERLDVLVATPELELETPFSASPAELLLADPEAWRLRDLVQLELATPYLRRRLEDQDGFSVENRLRNEGLRRSDRDVSVLDGAHKGCTVRVAASGPSLAEHFDALRAGGVPLVAVDSALAPLLAAGVVPDVVVTMDGNERSMLAVFDVPRERVRDVTLVYHPTSPHAVLAAWPGRRLAARPPGPRFEGFTRTVLWSSGSVLHAAVDLAARTRAARIELMGADFATPEGCTHVEGTAWRKSVEPHPARPRVLDGHGRPVLSLRNLVGYLHDLERYVAAHREIEFVNASRTGARIAGTRYHEELPHAA